MAFFPADVVYPKRDDQIFAHTEKPAQTTTINKPPTAKIQRQCLDDGCLQRSPYNVPYGSTEELHKDLGDQYRRETGQPSFGAVQYSPQYAKWLNQKTGSNITFSPPTFLTANPLERLKQGQSSGKTMFTINGRDMDGPNPMASLQNILQAIQPGQVTSSPGLVQGQTKCEFGPGFKINAGTKVIVTTPPGNRGWQAQLPANKLGNPPPAACSGKTNIPTTLRGNPSDQEYSQLVRDSEMEHVRALETLHNRHLVPYYHFITGLSATGGTPADCAANLRSRINQRDEQAAWGFFLGDAAETRRFDAPGSTHRGTLSVTEVKPNCSSVKMEHRHQNPQQSGRDPGNVRKIAPTVRRIDFNKLTVSGVKLLENGATLLTFSTQANANTALALMVAYGITEIRHIGPFQYLLANGAAPSGAMAGLSEIAIDPSLYQVTIKPDPTNTDNLHWSVSQVVQNRIIEIVNFQDNRDEAFSAVDIMRQFGFTYKVWIGPEALPELLYFRK